MTLSFFDAAASQFNLTFDIGCVVKTLTTFSTNALPWFNRLLLPTAIAVLSGCAGDMDIKPEPVAPRPIVKHSATTPAVDYALSLQGTPYIYGKASPEEGFDCSGFVKYVYDKNGVHLPRTVREMSNALTPVSNSNIHSGDLVFFNTSGNSASHVGIYVNESNFVHAPSSRAGKVMVSSLKNSYWREHFIDARRP